MDNTKTYRILIVDDIEDNRFTLDTMLSMIGEFEIDEAESGPEALKLIAANSYDLVILDIMMPGMTGLDVLAELDLAQAEVPLHIIVASALQDMNTIVKALELGALDYLPKPIEESLLAARIRQLVERKATDEQLRLQRERIDSDLRKAAEIQLSLCPKTTLNLNSASAGSSYSLYGSMTPAYEVGGDFFDYFVLSDGRAIFTVSDACGKGAPAAIYASRVHDLIRLFSQNNSHSDSPERFLCSVLEEANAIISTNNDDCWFVTVWVGLLDPNENSLWYCSAGHCEALLQSSDGKIEPLPCEVTQPVGIDERFDVTASVRQLEPGQKVYVYSDGATENMMDNGEFLGIDGLIDILELPEIPIAIEENIECITEAVMKRNVTGNPEDDVTLLCLTFDR